MMDLKDLPLKELLPATLFSPAKIVYISYVVLTGVKILPTPSLCVFLSISLIFLVIEVGHNDYLRIRLNTLAEKQGARS